MIWPQIRPKGDITQSPSTILKVFGSRVQAKIIEYESFTFVHTSEMEEKSARP